MNRRPTVPLRAVAVTITVAIAALLAQAARPGDARADGITTVDYELTSDSNLPAPTSSSSGPQVVFNVLPAGSIVPPTESDGSQGSPLTVLNTSSGLDQSQLIVALKSVAASGSTPAEQLFGLSFLGQGLQSAANGGKLDFSLSVDSALGAPTLTTTTPGIHVAELPLPTPTPTVTTTTATPSSAPAPRQPPGSADANVPEPVSMGLWSLLAGAGAWQARASRRRKAV